MESHNPEILKYIKKGVSRDDIIKGFQIIHKYKFESLAFFIIGFPNQTLEDAYATSDFIKIIKPTFILMNSLLAFPFSNFYLDLVRRGVYDKDHWQQYVLCPTKEYMLPSWRREGMEQAFMDVRDKIMKEFYLTPSFVFKEACYDISHFRYKQLKNKINMGMKMLFNSTKS